MTTQRTKRNVMWRVLAVLGALALLAAACGDDDDDVAVDDDDVVDDDTDVPDDDALAGFQESGVTIGIANEEPFGFEQDGEATGEAPEVAKAVFERLDIEITDFAVTDFDGLIPGLAADRFDVIAAGMFINPERAANALFSNPDYCSATAFAVPDGNPNSLNDFEDIVDNPDITLGVLSGAVEEGFAEDSGVPGGQIESLPSPADLFDALEVGRVDAVALTPITVEEQTAARDGLEAAEGFIPIIDGLPAPVCGGFAFTFENQELRDAFNDVLAEMQAANEILPIIEEFGFTQDDVDAAAATTANEQAQGAYDDLGDPPFEPPADDMDDAEEEDEG